MHIAHSIVENFVLFLLLLRETSESAVKFSIGSSLLNWPIHVGVRIENIKDKQPQKCIKIPTSNRY